MDHRGIATRRTEEYDATDNVMMNIEGFASFRAYQAAEN